MENNIIKEFIDCLKNNPSYAFSFMCENYHKFSKDELNDICKELLYAISHAEDTRTIFKSDREFIYETVIENLENYCLKEVYNILKEKFPEKEGYEITVTQWISRGTHIKM